MELLLPSISIMIGLLGLLDLSSFTLSFWIELLVARYVLFWWEIIQSRFGLLFPQNQLDSRDISAYLIQL